MSPIFFQSAVVCICIVSYLVIVAAAIAGYPI